MKIHAVTVSVQYADFLSIIIPRWKPFLASWTIVTDSKDEDTAKLAMENDLQQLVRTDAFYLDGATFNKGRALEVARRMLPQWEDWFLLVDADILPEPDWFKKLVAFDPSCGKIYGAYRHQCKDLADPDSERWPRIQDALCEGYFQLFHTRDSHIAALHPVIEMDWGHAGVYDSHLKANWPRENQAGLPIRLTHLGEQENWHGRGNREAFLKMNHERFRTGSYQHERIKISGQ